jgi:cytochrome c biogenesis protein
MPQTGGAQTTMALRLLKRSWHLLTQLKVAALLLLLVLLLAALGSCFPQLSPTLAADAGRLAAWQTGVRARFGPLTDVLAAVGLFNWFRSPLFLAASALLAIATLACTLDRWGRVWRSAFRAPFIPSDLAFQVAPHTARLAGLEPADLSAWLGDFLRQRGFRVELGHVADVRYLRAERHRLASLATLLTHLALLLLLVGALLSAAFGWREEVSLGPGASVPLAHKGRLALHNQGFSIDRYPDGSVAAYRAQVALTQDGQPVARGAVEVNRPLTYRGVTSYLSGYAGAGEEVTLTLLAARDPGYSLVVAAGFLLVLGLTLTFNFPRAWIQARVDAGGALQLAGWAGRGAWDFEREFDALVKELEARKAVGLKATGDRLCT